MHGLIFAQLRKFAEANFGEGIWNKLLAEAGLTGKMYLTVSEYPDADAVALVTAASKLSGQPAGVLLESFGTAIVPGLLQLYGHLVKPGWKTLEVIENTEQTIHQVVRRNNPGAKPPEIKVRRAGPDEVVVTYASARKMCQIAKGIAQGIAKHFGETITVTEPKCMHKGAATCEISVKTGK